MGWTIALGAAKQFGWLLVLLLIFWGAYRATKKFLAGPKPLPRVSAQVIQVDSGNSIQVSGGRRRERARTIQLHGIAIPDGDLGEQTRTYLDQLVGGKKIEMALTHGSTFRRASVAIVYTPENWDANKALIEHGLAWCRDPKQKEWVIAEKLARKTGVGIWAAARDGEPIEEIYESLHERERPMDNMNIVCVVETGSLAWLAIVLVASLLVVVATRYERPDFAAGAVILAGLGLILFGDIGEYFSLLLEPVTLMWGMGCYVICGLVGATMLWFLHVAEYREGFALLKQRFFYDNKLSYTDINAEVPETLLPTWYEALRPTQWVRRDGAGNIVGYTVNPSLWECRNTFLTWAAFWPWCVLYKLLETSLAKLWKFFFIRFGGVLDKVTKWAYPEPTDRLVAPVQPVPLAPEPVPEPVPVPLPVEGAK